MDPVMLSPFILQCLECCWLGERKGIPPVQNPSTSTPLIIIETTG